MQKLKKSINCVLFLLIFQDRIVADSSVWVRDPNSTKDILQQHKGMADGMHAFYVMFCIYHFFPFRFHLVQFYFPLSTSVNAASVSIFLNTFIYLFIFVCKIMLFQSVILIENLVWWFLIVSVYYKTFYLVGFVVLSVCNREFSMRICILLSMSLALRELHILVYILLSFCISAFNWWFFLFLQFVIEYLMAGALLSVCYREFSKLVCALLSVSHRSFIMVFLVFVLTVTEYFVSV